MRNKGLTISTAAVVLLAVVVVLLPELTVPQVAFAEVMEKMAEVQTLHMKFTRGGRSGQAWLKRPNMVRIEYEDGTWEIHNGPTHWVVDEEANKATKRSSWYYQDAQRRGLDVVDMLTELPHTEGFSGFFSEKPGERIRQEGRLLDIYRMETEHYGETLAFEAVVDAQSRMLRSMEIVQTRPGYAPSVAFALSIVEYDQPIADEKFAFEPKEGMTVVVKEPKPKEAPPAPEKGSTLSGRMVWASTGKPVPDASITLSAGDYVRDESGRSRQEFFTRVETDRQGRWEVSGVPAGMARISPRSWELNWPSVPTFENGLGSLQYPAIQVDGESRYEGLDFTVYKPEELFARITVAVTDEDGKPVEGVGGYLMGERPAMQHYGNVYAAPGKQFSGPDGTLDARDVWPTEDPVRLHVYQREEHSPLVTRAVSTEPFVVKSKQSYHFDVVVPYERRMSLRVVDPKGTPLEGVSVAVRDESGGWILPPYRPEEKNLFTDENGRTTLGRLMPGESVIVVLRRLRPGAEDVTSPMATAWFPARVPKEREVSSLEVTFDDRPIQIEGTIPLPGGPLRSKLLWCTVDRGTKGRELDLLVRSELDDSGAFAFTGVPAGNVRLWYRLFTAEGDLKRWQSENTICTEPGNTYTVKIVGKRVEVTGAKPTQAARTAPGSQ